MPVDQAGRLHASTDLSHSRIWFQLANASVTVHSGEPAAGALAFYLIEPEGDDGLVTWNVIEEGLEAGLTYPIYRGVDARAIVLRHCDLIQTRPLLAGDVDPASGLVVGNPVQDLVGGLRPLRDRP